MKIALMSGAYVNAGDFLIESRVKLLLERFLEGADVHILKRNIKYDNKIDELNSYDLIVFGGGPGYRKNIYPQSIPFISDLQTLHTPVVLLGWGWKGKAATGKYLYNLTFSEQTKTFLKFIESGGMPFGCRDWYTAHFLKNQGFNHTVMTGCPAWYDLCHIEHLKVNKIWKSEVASPFICISDPAYASNLPIMKPLIIYLREKYPDANIKMVLHRGLDKKDMLLQHDFLEKYNITYTDISGSVKGFDIYNECDLHIGFRVHAHIYNLSRGNISVLLNEDVRGAGVNDALGIQNIYLKPYGRILHRKIARGEIDMLMKTIEDYLQYISDTECLQYKNACENMRFYYLTMQKFIKDLKR